MGLIYTSDTDMYGADIPRWKGTHICVVYCIKYVDFMPNFVHITAWYCPKTFISSAIEKVRKERFDQSCSTCV